MLLHTVDLDEEVPRLVPRLAIILHGPRRQHTDGPTYRCEMGPRRRRLSCSRRGEGREPSCDLISRSSKNRSGREPRQREQGKPNTRVERFKAVICNRPLRVRQPRAAPVPHVRQHSLSVWVGAVLHRREVSLHDAGASARVQVMHRLPPVTAPSNSARGARGSGQSS